jgi:uncharacterized protein
VGAAPAKQADFLRAIAGAAPRDVTALYWYARVTLLADIAGLAAFDRVFDAWFVRGLLVDAVVPPLSDVDGAVVASGESGQLSTMDARPGGGTTASALATAGGREFAGSDARQRDLMRSLRDAWPANLPVIPSRRRRPARSGRALDMRRVWRQARRDGGELTQMHWTTRPPRARRLLLLLDVSGSLKQHTPDLLRLVYTARQARTEVFTFGTRLTRITGALAAARVDTALAAVSRTVTDADGGTAIGESLRRFLANPRYLALARGALIVVISDGLERGDPTAMVRATERLSRLGHRLVWWSPLACSPTYRPVTRGMADLLRHLDHLGGVRDLATGLSEVERIPAVVAGPRRAAWRLFPSGAGT